MRKTVTIKGGTRLEILEPTQVPGPILAICRKNHIIPNFYSKMGNMYCLHYGDNEDECGFAFFIMIDGIVHVPERGQPKLVGLARCIGDLVHGEKEQETR